MKTSQKKIPEKKFDLRRIFSSAEIVLVGKDLGAIWRSKGTRAVLMLLPVVLIVLIPLVYSVAISFLPSEGALALPDKLADLVGGGSMIMVPGGSGWRRLPPSFVPCCFCAYR